MEKFFISNFPLETYPTEGAGANNIKYEELRFPLIELLSLF